MVSQREHFIEGHRMRVELALPMVNDSLYEKDVVVPGKDALGFHASCKGPRRHGLVVRAVACEARAPGFDFSSEQLVFLLSPRV